MGNIPVTLIVSDLNPPVGSEVTFICDNATNNHVFELLSPLGKSIVKSNLKKSEVKFTWTVPAGDSGQYIAKVMESNTVVKECILYVDCPIISCKNGVTLALTTSPYCDFPQVLSIQRQKKFQRGEYIAAYVNGHRDCWEYCDDKESLTLNVACKSPSQKLKMTFFEGGNFFNTGTEIMELSYQLRNPIEKITVAEKKITSPAVIEITYAMTRLPNSCEIVAKCQNITLQTFPLSATAIEGQFQFPSLRIAETITVECLAVANGNRSIYSKDLKIESFETAIAFANTPKDHRLLCIAPYTMVTVMSRGNTIQMNDEVIVLPTTAIDDKPDTTALQNPKSFVKVEPLGSSGINTFQIEKEGIYHICLTLFHYGTIRLLADYVTVLVSNRCQVVRSPQVLSEATRFRLCLRTPQDQSDRILCLHPGQTFVTEARGTAITPKDTVVVRKATSVASEPSSSFRDEDILMQSEVGVNGICSFATQEQGIFHVILTFRNDATAVVGDWCTVIISSKISRESYQDPMKLPPRLLTAAEGRSEVIVFNQYKLVLSDEITTSPRQIMKRVFSLQGYHVDPFECEAAANGVVAFMNNNGKTNKNVMITKDGYDCFISYRVDTDRMFAELLYLYLKNQGINAFFDKKCLQPGAAWKDEFLNGLCKSNYFIALISRDGLRNVRDAARNHANDSVLLEYETALKIKDLIGGSRSYFCPLFVGSRNGSVLQKFEEFNENLYSNTISP